VAPPAEGAPPQTPAPTVATTASEDYRGVHRAPRGEFGEGSLDAMNKTYPADIYSPDAPRLYGDRHSASMDRKAHKVIMSVRGKPNAEVTVYRAVPAGVQEEIKPGDWVTPVREYAEGHGNRFEEGSRIISRKVKASELFTEGNSIFEYGWQPTSQVSAETMELPKRPLEGAVPGMTVEGRPPEVGAPGVEGAPPDAVAIHGWSGRGVGGGCSMGRQTGEQSMTIIETSKNGVSIQLTGDEVAIAIDAYLVARGVNVSGPRTVLVNGRLCELGEVYVDPSGSVNVNA
jgi:hypothetical protein